MAETIHTFTGGMDLDTEKALRSNNVTHLVQNLRLVTGEHGTTGALEAIRGNTLLSSIDGMDEIYGWCLIRNYLVIFCRSYIPYPVAIPPTNSNAIFKITLDDNDEFVSSEQIYNDYYNNSSGTLDFPETGIKTLGRYESEDIVKVYWCDNVNPVRFINIAVNNTTDGEDFNGSTNYYIGTDKLEFSPTFNIVDLTSIEVKKGGSLQAGTIQYMYQLYNKYGTETVFSPLSNPVHLVESSDTSSSGNKYKGSDVGVNTGKSVELVITHTDDNVGYDGLKVVRVLYTTYGSLPTVDLVADIEIEKYFTTTSKTYKVIDTGVSIYNYTAEEVSVLNKILFTAKDIATKDDLLFFGNIQEDYFDVDFDARAFRFPSNDTKFYIVNDSVTEEYTIADDDDDDEWDSILATLGEDNDCINLYNDLTYDNKTNYSQDQYNCVYKHNSLVYGGTGRNVQYGFTTESFVLDSKADTTKNGSNPMARVLDVSLGIDDNYSYTNYASPYMSMNYKGYQRGEIYRFGIVFFDIKGRASKVKWIGDIRFPNLSTTGYGNLAGKDSMDIDSEALGIDFKVRNVPTEAVAWTIVRMDRKSKDRTVVSTGVLSNIVEFDGADVDIGLPQFPVMKAAAVDAYGASTNHDLVTDVLAFISPDINYGELDYKNGDYFETVGWLDDYGTYASETATPDENVIKYTDFTSTTNYNLLTPNKVIITSTTYPSTEYGIGGLEVSSQAYWGSGVASILGTCMLFTYDEVTVPVYTGGTMHVPTMVYLRRLNSSQYGGNTYESRFGNEYISCGKIVDSSSASFTRANTAYGSLTVVPIYGGDTYIVMFEKLYGIYHDGDNESCRICYIPLESKYNLSINHGFTYSRNTDVDPDIRLVRENAGSHIETSSSLLLEQTEDFYIYNTVYSTTDQLIHYFSASNIDNEIEDYDTRVIVSNRKYNNEVIDNWTKFSPNNFVDVDTSYGSLNNLVNLKNKLFFLQDRGFGILSINERAVVVDTANPGALSLGTGGILDRYDYLSTYYGNTNIYGVLSNESGIYWVDNFKSELVLFNGDSVIPLSKAKKIDSFFKENYGTITDVRASYSSKYNEALFNITAGATSLNILVFNELMNCFTGFYTIPAVDFIPLRKKLLSIYDSSGDHYLCDEDSNDTTCHFEGDVSTEQHEAVLTILHTEGYPTIKVYDNIEYQSTSKDSSGVNQPEDTFNTIQVYNDYQDTGEITLTYKTNLERRQRTWTTYIPRDVTLSSKERMRDSHSYIKFTYSNGNTFYVPYIKVKFRSSIR